MGFDAIPSINEILSQASNFANPFFAEFWWVIVVSFAITVLIGVIYFLPSVFQYIWNSLSGKSKKYENNTWRYENINQELPDGKRIWIRKKRVFRDEPFTGYENWLNK